MILYTRLIPQSPELMLLFWRVIANVKTRFASFAEEGTCDVDFQSGFDVRTKQKSDANNHVFWAFQPNSISWASDISFASGIDSRLKPKQQGNDLAANAGLQCCA